MGQTPASVTQVVRFGVFEVDLQAAELRKNGVKVKLQEQPFQILNLLLERPGKVVTREEIQHKLWSEDTFVDFEHSLNAAVKRLREALGDSAETPRFVETLPRRGYRFIYPVERPGRASRIRQVRIVALAVVAVLAVLIGLNVAGLRERLLGGAGRGQITSIAVLPLENLSGDPEQEYFVDGMTEALITELGKVSALRVISRQSVMRFKKTDLSMPEIAAKLDVDAIVEGTVLHVGGKVRISAQLIRALPEQHLWAENYDRELKDVLALHSEVARAIAREIQITVTPAEEAHLASTYPVDPEVYELYLRGRYHQDKYSRQGTEQAVEYFEQAIAKDPTFAPAHAGLAIVYGLLAEVYRSPLGETRETMLAKSDAALRKALELGDVDSETHALLGWFHFWDYEWESAEGEFKRALELNPSNANAHHGYAFSLKEMGRVEEAISEMKTAQQLNPLSVRITVAAHAPYYIGRQYDEAIKQLHRALELDPNGARIHDYLGKVYVAKGMYEEAIAACQKALALAGDHPMFLSTLTWAYSAAGRRSEALKVLEQLKVESKRRDASPFFIARAYAGLKDKDQALRWLEKTYEEHSGWLVALSDPIFDNLRDDPRFQSLLRRMNFPSR